MTHHTCLTTEWLERFGLLGTKVWDIGVPW